MTELPNRISDLGEILEIKEENRIPENALQIGANRNIQQRGQVVESQEEITNALDTLSEWADVRIEKTPNNLDASTLKIHSQNNKLKIHNLHGGSGDITTLVKNALIVESSQSGNAQIFENCKILKLTLNSNCRYVKIKNCKIGVLVLPGNAPNFTIHIEGSNFCQVKVPATFEAADFKIKQCLFSGHFEKSRLLDRIKLGVSSARLPRLDRQSFSNLQNWASRVGNSEVAHVARGNELRIETVEAKGIEKAFLVIWRFFGDYGLSPARPLIWLLVFTVILFAVLLCQGTVVLFSDLESGWQSTLIDGVGSDSAYRSAVATFNNLISPWSFLSPRRMVQPATTFGIVSMGIHSALTVMLILLTGFSLRRRFRFS